MRNSLLPVVFFSLATAAAASPDRTQEIQDLLGWVNQELLTPEQRAHMPAGCCGMFVEPEITPEEAQREETEISGNSSQGTEDNAAITGNVHLRQGARSAGSDSLTLKQQQYATLDGNVNFREPGVLLLGDHADLDLDERTIAVTNAQYVIVSRHLHGHAQSLTRDKQGVIVLKNNSYSSCTPGDEIWFLKSSTMTLDPNTEQGHATNVRLEVLDIPVFYFPYLQFPIGGQRQSGFLPPAISSGKDGLDITAPYYLNLAPNYDATLSPRSIADRGTELGTEVRGLTEHTTTKFTGAFLHHDELSSQPCPIAKAGQPVTTDCNEQNRWMVALKENGGKYSPWYTLIDYTRVSDNNYLTDFDKTNLSTSQASYLKQQEKVGYLTDNWDTSIDIEQFQMLQENSVDNPYKKRPELSALGNYYLGNGFDLDLSQRYAQFVRNDATQSSGNRFAADYDFSWRNEWQGGYLKPGIQAHFLSQQLQSSTVTDNPAVAIPSASIDAGLMFERDDGELHQTLEPRLFYHYTPYKNQDDFNLFDTGERNFSYYQLFSPNRFNGADRIGDANDISAGVLSRWLDPKTGAETVQFGVGETYYSSDRRITAFSPADYQLLPAEYRERFTQPYSPLAAELQWQFVPRWRLASELVYDFNQAAAQRADLFLHYRDNNGQELFSTGFRHTQSLIVDKLNASPPYAFALENENQIDISTFWPINRQWGAMGRFDYDLNHTRALVTLAGIQYENCCLRLRAAYRNWLTPSQIEVTSGTMAQVQNENGFYFEIQLKSLAGIGTKMDGLFKDSIYGYKQSALGQTTNPN